MNIEWERTTQERFDEMLGMLPPAVQTGKGFLVGEPMIHRTCRHLGRTEPAFTAFIELGGAYFKAKEPLTIAEFSQISRTGLSLPAVRSDAMGEQHD